VKNIILKVSNIEGTLTDDVCPTCRCDLLFVIRSCNYMCFILLHIFSRRLQPMDSDESRLACAEHGDQTDLPQVVMSRPLLTVTDSAGTTGRIIIH
jgi:hypothetical protein